MIGKKPREYSTSAGSSLPAAARWRRSQKRSMPATMPVTTTKDSSTALKLMYCASMPKPPTSTPM